MKTKHKMTNGVARCAICTKLGTAKAPLLTRDQYNVPGYVRWRDNPPKWYGKMNHRACIEKEIRRLADRNNAEHALGRLFPQR